MTLKYLRMRSGKTMSEVAAEAGITKQRYHYIESNDSLHRSSEETARRIANALGVNLFDVCGADVLKFRPRTKEEKESLLEAIKAMETL